MKNRHIHVHIGRKGNVRVTDSDTLSPLEEEQAIREARRHLVEASKLVAKLAMRAQKPRTKQVVEMVDPMIVRASALMSGIKDH